MQLKQFAKVTGALATASCALLGTPAHAQNDDDWKIDTALLYYGESDSRVKAVEGIVAGQKAFDFGELLNLKVTFDTLTGASPTGAVPQPNIQTFTRPSGQGSYSVDVGSTPLDDTFKDTRVQLNGQWTQPWGKLNTISAGMHFSKEYDYMSMGFNTTFARDFNQKNTTLSAGLSYSRDTVNPEGGRPIPFYSVLAVGGEEGEDYDGEYDGQNEGQQSNHSQSRLDGDGKKDIFDMLLGVTQVINRRMIMQFNYSYSKSDGYLTDPFKMLSIVDSEGITQDMLYENRPDKRTKQSFYWQTKYHFDAMTADVSYRYMHDDWQIKSNTVDTHLRFPLGDGSYIEPHFRFYKQDAAEFYRPFLNENETLPQFASADYRIGSFNALTVGAKYAMPLSSGRTLAFRVEYYKQNPNTDGFDIPGVLKNYQLNPGVSALILQMSYSF